MTGYALLFSNHSPSKLVIELASYQWFLYKVSLITLNEAYAYISKKSVESPDLHFLQKVILDQLPNGKALLIVLGQHWVKFIHMQPYFTV